MLPVLTHSLYFDIDVLRVYPRYTWRVSAQIIIQIPIPWHPKANICLKLL